MKPVIKDIEFLSVEAIVYILGMVWNFTGHPLALFQKSGQNEVRRSQSDFTKKCNFPCFEGHWDLL